MLTRSSADFCIWVLKDDDLGVTALQAKKHKFWQYLELAHLGILVFYN